MFTQTKVPSHVGGLARTGGLGGDIVIRNPRMPRGPLFHAMLNITNPQSMDLVDSLILQMKDVFFPGPTAPFLFHLGGDEVFEAEPIPATALARWLHSRGWSPQGRRRKDIEAASLSQFNIMLRATRGWQALELAGGRVVRWEESIPRGGLTEGDGVGQGVGVAAGDVIIGSWTATRRGRELRDLTRLGYEVLVTVGTSCALHKS